MNQHIASWRQRLTDEEAWYRLPSFEYLAASQEADKLLASGLIDDLEHFDLINEARAARDYYIEEIAGDLIQPDRQFDVLEHDAKVGRIDGALLSLDDSSSRLMIKRCRTGHYIHESTLNYAVGRVVGDQLLFVAGRIMRIIHVSTRVNSVEVPV